MGFNYRYEKVKFYEEWLPKQKMMREVGMSEEAIQQMFDYDWNWFKDRRRHESRQKPFTEDPYTYSEEDYELLQKAIARNMEEQSKNYIDNIEAFDVIDKIEDERLLNALKQLKEAELELIMLYAIKGMQVQEIAKLKNRSVSTISEKLTRIKKIIKNNY